jgi:HTH-type transcriptional regulator/antitoxin HigA
MPTKTYPYRPDYVVGPGEVLTEHVQSMDIEPEELARRAGMEPQHVEALLAGEAAVDLDVARRLEKATGLGAEIWLALEARWRARPDRAGERSGALASVRR